MDELEAQIPSKSARKRQAHEVEDLARKLVDMNATDIAALELGPQFMAVVERARGLKKGRANARSSTWPGCCAVMRRNWSRCAAIRTG